MATNITTTKSDVEALYRALIAGINANLPNITSFILNGQTYPRADLLAQLQARIDAAEASKTAQKQYRALVAAERELNRTVGRLRAAMKRYLESMYGPGSPMLQQFGFAPAAPPKTKASVKAEAQVKAKATREARHTMGKKQRKGVNGTPASPPASPSASAATSPSTSTSVPASPSVSAPGNGSAPHGQ